MFVYYLAAKLVRITSIRKYFWNQPQSPTEILGKSPALGVLVNDQEHNRKNIPLKLFQHFVKEIIENGILTHDNFSDTALGVNDNLSGEALHAI